MLQAIVCGYLGADAVTKNENGREFTSFRVAHSDRWTDANGNPQESTTWVDVILNGRPKVTEFLKAGTLVYVSGHTRLRCYSSEKARGFVAGMTISAVHIELLGGKTDEVPRRLYDEDGVMHEVQRFFHTQMAGGILMNQRGDKFAVDDNGWVLPMADAPTDVQQASEPATSSSQTNTKSANSTKSKTKKK